MAAIARVGAWSIVSTQGVYGGVLCTFDRSDLVMIVEKRGYYFRLH